MESGLGDLEVFLETGKVSEVPDTCKGVSRGYAIVRPIARHILAGFVMMKVVLYEKSSAPYLSLKKLHMYHMKKIWGFGMLRIAPYVIDDIPFFPLTDIE